MKTNKILLPIAVSLVTLSLAGCSKQDSDASQAEKDVKQAATSVSDALKQTADNAQAAAKTAVADASGKAQEWIDKAKQLVAQNKFSEAASALQQLGALKLTPDQQKLVDDLKAQVQKALGTKASGEGAVGNLLKK